MKKAFIILGTMTVLAGCGNSDGERKEQTFSAIQETSVKPEDEQAEQEAVPTSLKFDKEVHDFGNIKVGSENNCTFRVTNTGKNPLIIYNTSASCGCTTPKKPEKPIAPGQSDVIEVGFKPSTTGDIEKTVTVQANTEPRVQVVKIKAHVE